MSFFKVGRGNGNQGRGGGGRGGGYGSNFDGKLTALGTDRFCSACGGIIKGFATTVYGKCPHQTCGAPIQLMTTADEEFNDVGWGRCRNCKSFMHRCHMHCQNCRHLNITAKERADRLKKKALMEERAKMKKESDDKDAKIARLEEQLKELNDVVSRQEMENGDLDEKLSQIDEASIIGTGCSKGSIVGKVKGNETLEAAGGSDAFSTENPQKKAGSAKDSAAEKEDGESVDDSTEKTDV